MNTVDSYWRMRKNHDSSFPNLFLILAGPTGTGKSSTALQLCKLIPGEIINGDSRQFYKEINVGTAKPPLSARKEVRHHLYDFLTLKEDFSVFDFRKHLERIVPEIWSQGKAAILVGGSGLYIRAIVKGIFDFPEEKKPLQNATRMQLLKMEKEELYEKLKAVDAQCAQRIHPHDRRRIIRALEVYLMTGKPMSSWQQESRPASFIPAAAVKYWIFYMARQKLYQVLDARTQAMLESGWLQEVKNLINAGLKKYLVEKAPLGYLELCSYLEGKLSWEEAVEMIKRKTRQYARRQLTWFRKEKDGEWIDVTASQPEETARLLAEKIFRENRKTRRKDGFLSGY